MFFRVQSMSIFLPLLPLCVFYWARFRLKAFCFFLTLCVCGWGWYVEDDGDDEYE